MSSILFLKKGKTQEANLYDRLTIKSLRDKDRIEQFADLEMREPITKK